MLLRGDAGERWRRCLSGTLQPMAAPYGYTLVVWGTGTLSVWRWGPLNPGHAAAFAMGALLSTIVLTALAWGAMAAGVPSPGEPRPAGSTIHWLAAPLSFTCAWLVTHLPLGPLLGTSLAAFTATLAYQIFVSLERYLLSGHEC